MSDSLITQFQNALAANPNMSANDVQSLISKTFTDPNMTSADWGWLTSSGYAPGGSGGGPPAGIPADQWSMFGLAPPPGSPAAYDYWRQMEYGNTQGIAPEFQNLAPVDPSQYGDMYERMTQNVSAYGGGMQIPVGVSGSQFNPTPGNPNFTINPSGYGVLTPQGQQNLNDYAMQQLQGIYSNAAKNKSGLSGFLSGPGGLSLLALPFAAAGAGAGLSALGAIPGAEAGGAVTAADLAGWSPIAGSEAVGSVPSDITLGATTAEGAGGAAAGSTGSSLLNLVTNPIGTIGGQLGLPDWATTGLRAASALQKIASLASSLGGGGTAGGGGVSAGGTGRAAGGGMPFSPTLLQFIQQIVQDISRQGRGG
jgi:hypothetical protein